MREQDRLTKAKHAAANKELNLALNRRPKYENGDRGWFYDDQAKTTGGGSQVHEEKYAGQNNKSLDYFAWLSFCWTRPSKISLTGRETTINGDRFKVLANTRFVET